MRKTVIPTYKTALLYPSSPQSEGWYGFEVQVISMFMLKYLHNVTIVVVNFQTTVGVII